MSVLLVDIPRDRRNLHGGLWFIIPDELQEHVIPWLKMKMSEVPTLAHRQHYRRQMTKDSLKLGEGGDIWWKSSFGNSLSAIYHRDGQWRVGHRGAAANLMRNIEDDFLHELRMFARQRPEWVKLEKISDTA